MESTWSILYLGAQWPLRTSQFLGYYPLSMKGPKKVSGLKSSTHREFKSVQSKLISLPQIISIFLILSLPSAALNIWLNHESTRSWVTDKDSKGNTTKFITFLMWCSTLLWCPALTRLDMLIHRKELEIFWDKVEASVDFLRIALGVDRELVQFSKACRRRYQIITCLYGSCILYMACMVSKSIMFTGDAALLDALCFGALSLASLFHYFSLVSVQYFLQVQKFSLEILSQHADLLYCCHRNQFHPGTKNSLNDNEKIFITINPFCKKEKVRKITPNLLIECYSQVEEQIQDFNSIFGRRMLLETLYYFSQTVYYAYTLAQLYNMEGPFLMNIVTILILSYSLYSVCKLSSEITSLGKQFFKKCINKIFEKVKASGCSDSDYVDHPQIINTQLLMTYMSMSNNSIQVGNSICDFNLQFFTSILGVTATYIVVLFQFQAGDNS